MEKLVELLSGSNPIVFVAFVVAVIFLFCCFVGLALTSMETVVMGALWPQWLGKIKSWFKSGG